MVVKLMLMAPTATSAVAANAELRKLFTFIFFIKNFII
jgi:hypothetical protein